MAEGVNIVEKPTADDIDINNLFFINKDDSLQQISLSSLLPTSFHMNNMRPGGPKDLIADLGYTEAQIHTMVSAGTFDDIFVGDYIDKSITTSVPSVTVSEDDGSDVVTTTEVTETCRFEIQDMDYYLRRGSTSLTSHHLVIMPKNCFKTKNSMNSSNTTSGGYLNSYMQQTVLPAYLTAIQSAFTSSYIISWYDYLTNTVTTTSANTVGLTGATTAGEWTQIYMRLPNQMMIYGSSPCTNSRYDTMVANQQLALFRIKHDSLQAGAGGTSDSRTSWWLSDVASSANFAVASTYGNTTNYSASNSYGVRPLFLFG